MCCLATRLLFSCLSWDKIIPEFYGNTAFINIGAFQVSSFESDYLNNIFDILYFPWEDFPNTFPSVGRIVSDYYTESLQQKFWDSIKMNIQYDVFRRGKLNSFLEQIINEDCPIIYGIGNTFAKESETFHLDAMLDSFTLIDQRADELVTYKGRSVYKPEKIVLYSDKPIILFLANNSERENLRESIGHSNVYFGILDYLVCALKRISCTERCISK